MTNTMLRAFDKYVAAPLLVGAAMTGASYAARNFGYQLPLEGYQMFLSSAAAAEVGINAADAVRWMARCLRQDSGF